MLSEWKITKHKLHNPVGFMADHEKSACKTYVRNTVDFPARLCGSWPPGIVGRERLCLHLTLERSESTGLARTIANIDHFTALSMCFSQNFCKTLSFGPRRFIFKSIKHTSPSEVEHHIWVLQRHLTFNLNQSGSSEKFASAHCPWRNHDAVLDFLHQTSDFHRCSILKMHCEDMQSHAKMCKADFVCSELWRMAEAAMSLDLWYALANFSSKDFQVSTLLIFSRAQSLGSWQSVWIFPFFRPVSHDHWWNRWNQWTTTL